MLCIAKLEKTTGGIQFKMEEERKQEKLHFSKLLKKTAEELRATAEKVKAWSLSDEEALDVMYELRADIAILIKTKAKADDELAKKLEEETKNGTTGNN